MALVTQASKWSRPAREARHRLTDEERRFRALREADLQHQVTDLLDLLGYGWSHWRALRNSRGIWQVPVEGPIGVGWPDLFALRPRDRRLVALELKRELEDPTPEQMSVLGQLEACGVGVRVIRPSDLRDPIETSDLFTWLRGSGR